METPPLKSGSADAGLLSLAAGVIAYGWKSWRNRRQKKRDEEASVKVATITANARIEVAETEAETHTMDQLWRRIDKLEARIALLEGERLQLAEKLAEEKVQTVRLQTLLTEAGETIKEQEQRIADLEAQLATRTRIFGP